MAAKVAGIEPGQRHLNGTQATGRDYRNLSSPDYTMTRDDDVPVPMRDGVSLLADVIRPDAAGQFPVLIAASPYPRQIQDLGAPFGFLEAGASDFFVPRGYVHVIANLRGTSGSAGVFGFFDGQERRDMYDLVEWAAAQPWSDGNVGMIGISYFGMTQLEAAVEQPPHLKAIFPLEATIDLYTAAMHHGLMSSSFVTTFLAMIGMTSGHTNKLWRSRLVGGIRELLNQPHVHGKFASSNGDAAMAGLRLLLKLHHDPHPWDDLWRAVAVEHPVRDDWWEERSLVPLLDRIEIPVYLGCDWQNVPLHLPGTLASIGALPNSSHVRVAMLGEHGISWPWESLHVETLAWYDQWLKSRHRRPGRAADPLLQDVAPDGAGQNVTAGYLRASLRAVGEKASQPGSVSLLCRSPEIVPVNEPVRYRLPLVGTAWRFRAGHRIRLILTSDDQDEKFPAMMTFRHASVGTSSLNRIASSSRLILPAPSLSDPEP